MLKVLNRLPAYVTNLLVTTVCTMMGVHLQMGCVEVMVIKRTFIWKTVIV